MKIKNLNTKFYLISSTFILLINLLTITKRNNILNLNKETCNDSLMSKAKESGFDFFVDNVFAVHKSIFPEIFNYKLFSQKCFGSVNEIVLEDYFINLYFISSKYLFFIFFVIFNVLIIYFLTYEKTKIKLYLKYLILFLTVFNLFNFDFYYLSFVFLIIFYYSIILIVYYSIYKNEISSKKIVEENLIIYLSSWVITISLEHYNLIFYRSEYYHFKLWITNYLQGYNRRGLIGQVIYHVGELFDIRYVVLILFITILSAIAYFLYKIFINRYQNIISYFLLLSPAFISYQILDIRGSMRKEVLGLLTFVMIVYFINKGKSLTFPLLIFTIAVFSHPANIFISPFLIGYLHKNDINKKVKILFFVPVLIYLSSGVFFTPSESFNSLIFCEQTNQLINSSIDCKLLDSGDLEGTINSDIYDYLELTKKSIQSREIIFYIISFLLALSPFVFLQEYFIRNKYLGFMLIPYLMLFFVAFDWGRWISLYISILTITYFNDNQKNKLESYKFPLSVLLILFLVFWDLPHCCIDRNLPFFSLKLAFTNLPIYTFTELYFSELLTLR